MAVSLFLIANPPFLTWIIALGWWGTMVGTDGLNGMIQSVHCPDVIHIIRTAECSSYYQTVYTGLRVRYRYH